MLEELRSILQGETLQDHSATEAEWRREVNRVLNDSIKKIQEEKEAAMIALSLAKVRARMIRDEAAEAAWKEAVS